MVYVCLASVESVASWKYQKSFREDAKYLHMISDYHHFLRVKEIYRDLIIFMESNV